MRRLLKPFASRASFRKSASCTIDADHTATSHVMGKHHVALVFASAGATLTLLRTTTGDTATLGVADFMAASYALPSDLLIMSVDFPLATAATTVLDSYKVCHHHSAAM